MKSFQVVIVTILFMALLMTSDAHKRGKCKKKLNKARKELEQCEAKLQDAKELNNELQNETSGLKKELEECKKPIPTESKPLTKENRRIPPECQNYQTLSTGDRKNTYISSQTSAGRTGCDNNLGPAWFRFQGASGTKMATSCVPAHRCGTHSTGWLNGAHPTVNEGQVTRKACFSWSSKCCTWSIDIKVRNCGDFYVYYINKTPPEHKCHLRYCGSD